MSRLTQDDLEVIEGGARISCLRICGALEIASLQSVHRLIERHRDEIEQYGPVIRQTSEGSGSNRPTVRYLVNQEQALLLCMFSRSKKAKEARSQIVRVFFAYTSGDKYALAQEAQKPDPFMQAATRSKSVSIQMKLLSEMPDFIRQSAYLPVWTSGRRPQWWWDIEVRTFMIGTHRQMSTLQAEMLGAEMFGNRCPRKSAISDFWRKMDVAKGMRQCVVPVVGPLVSDDIVRTSSVARARETITFSNPTDTAQIACIYLCG